jgi:hypothetical protein
MKAEIRIPKGWRRLRSNEIIRKGDKFWSAGDWYKSMNWTVGPLRAGEHTGSTYIRRKVKKARTR